MLTLVAPLRSCCRTRSNTRGCQREKSEARKSNTDRPATSAVMSMLETRESPLLANSIERIMNDDRTLTVDLPTWTGGDTKAVLGDSDYTIRNPQIYFQRESVIKAHSGRASEAPLQSMERMSRKSVPNNIKVGDNFNGKSAFTNRVVPVHSKEERNFLALGGY